MHLPDRRKKTLSSIFVELIFSIFVLFFHPFFSISIHIFPTKEHYNVGNNKKKRRKRIKRKLKELIKKAHNYWIKILSFFYLNIQPAMLQQHYHHSGNNVYLHCCVTYRWCCGVFCDWVLGKDMMRMNSILWWYCRAVTKGWEIYFNGDKLKADLVLDCGWR